MWCMAFLEVVVRCTRENDSKNGPKCAILQNWLKTHPKVEIMQNKFVSTMAIHLRTGLEFWMVLWIFGGGIDIYFVCLSNLKLLHYSMGFKQVLKRGNLWAVSYFGTPLTAPVETPLSAIEMGNGAAAQIAPAASVSGGAKKRQGSMGHGSTTESTTRRGITLNFVLSGRQPSAPLALPST